MDVKVKRPLNELSVTDIAAKIASGEAACEAVACDCLERIAARDHVVKAFVNLDPDHVLGQARTLDRGPIGVRCTVCRSDSRTRSIRSTCRPKWARRSFAVIVRAGTHPASRCCAAPAP